VAGAETASLPPAGRAPGIALALASMTTIQLGAALSEPRFDEVGAAGTVALRLALAALILFPSHGRACAGGRARTSAPSSRSARAPAC
jgi:threonine/homoserine efflux transporter RhtA